MCTHKGGVYYSISFRLESVCAVKAFLLYQGEIWSLYMPCPQEMQTRMNSKDETFVHLQDPQAVSVWRLEPVLWSSSESVSLSVCLQWALFSHRGNAQSMCYNWCLGRSACVVVGPWADHGREQGSNIQRAEVLKTMKRVTAVTDCAFDALFFDLWSFCCCCFFPQFSCSQWTLLLLPAAFWPTCQAINISSRTLRPLPVTHSQDLGGLRSSTSGVGEPHVCLVVVCLFVFFRVTKACANPD